MGEVVVPPAAPALDGAASDRAALAGIWRTLATAIVAVIVGAAGVRTPVVFAIVAGLVLVAGVCAFAYARPAQALFVAFALIPIAQTKFRRRSAAASASGEMDAQVLLELGLYALVAAIALFATRSRAFRRRPLSRTELLIGAYVAVAVLSVLWSLTPMLTAVKGTQLAILYAIGLTAARVLQPGERMRAIARALVPYVLVFAAIAAAVPGTRSLAIKPTNLARFAWFYVHPITAATLTSLALIAVYTRQRRVGAAARRPTRGISWRGVAVALPLVAILVATRSRGPALALLAAMTVLLVRSRAPRWLVAASGAGALLALAAFLNSGFTFVDWLGSHSRDPLVGFLLREQTAGDIAEFSGRDELWKAARALFAARPALGYGYGGARLLLLGAVPWAGDAHNALIQSALDVGVLGTLPLLAAIALGVIAAARHADWSQRGVASVAGAALGYLVFAIVSSATDVCFSEPGFVFLLVACCVPAVERARAAATPAASRRRRAA